MTELTGFLYARPSFLEGMARLFDFGNTLSEYNRSLTGEQADFLALRADWRAAAKDLGIALNDCIEEAETAKASNG